MATFFDPPPQVRDTMYGYYVFAVLDSARNPKACFSHLNGEAGLFVGDLNRMAIEAFSISHTVFQLVQIADLTGFRRRRGCWERRPRALQLEVIEMIHDDRVLGVFSREVHRERGSQTGAYIACQRISEAGKALCAKSREGWYLLSSAFGKFAIFGLACSGRSHRRKVRGMLTPALSTYPRPSLV